MAQKLLEGQNIHIPGLIHQRGSGMAQFMGGKALEPGRFHGSGDELLYPAVGDAFFAPPGDEHGTFFGAQALHCIALV